MVRLVALIPVLALAACAACTHKPKASTFTYVSPATQPDEPDADAEYRLQGGDVVDLKFFYQPELNEQVTVRPDGRISLQLIDDVRVTGMTTTELRQRLTTLYAQQVKNPTVTVILRSANDRKIFVGGEVKTPGVIALDGELTALQSIMQAGGLTTTAQTDNVVVLRDQGTARPQVITIDLLSDIEASGQRHDIRLRPRDIVFVPKTTIGRADDFMEQYVEKLLPFTRSVGVFYDLSPNRAR